MSKEVIPDFNGIIRDYDALNNKPTIDGTDIQGELTGNSDYFDGAPTEGSKKLVSSGDIKTALDKKSDTSHNHDGRYYTETETDELLSGKSDSVHTHNFDKLENKPTINGKDISGDVAEDILNLMADAEGSPFEHNHDSRYYTETETDKLLSGKSDSKHIHSYSALSEKPSINGIPLNGDADVDGLMFRRVLTADDDLDNIFEDGVYVYSTSSVPVNAPFTNAAVIEVFGAKSTTTQKIQRAYRYGASGFSAYRPLYSGKWGNWTKGCICYEITFDVAAGGSVTFTNGQTAAQLYNDIENGTPVIVAAKGETELFFYPTVKLAGTYVMCCTSKNGMQYSFGLSADSTANVEKTNAYADYIIEQGSSGIWTYQKWASGIAKCWGRVEIETTIQTASGSIFRGDDTYSYDFPFAFAEPPVCSVDVEANYACWGVTSGKIETTTTHTRGVMLYRMTAINDTVAAKLIFNIYGKWK